MDDASQEGLPDFPGSHNGAAFSLLKNTKKQKSAK